MRWRILVALLLLPSLAHGQEIETIPPGPDKIQPVKAQEPAPYAGVLYDNDTALRWANWLRQYKVRLKADVEKEQKVCAVKLSYEAGVLATEKRRSKELQDDLKARLQTSEKARLEAEERARNPPWYTTAWFGAGVGVVGAATIAGVTAWALSSSR